MHTFKQFIIEVRYKSFIKPKIAYHGTTKGKINKFNIPSQSHNNLGFLGNVETTRHGAFFSDNAEYSKTYGDVNRYNLHIKNTYNIHKDSHLDFADSLDAFGPHRDTWIAAKNIKHHWQLFDGELGKHFTNWLKQNGHDSAHFKEYDEKSGKESNTTVVLDSDNIKSSHSSKDKLRTKKLQIKAP